MLLFLWTNGSPANTKGSLALRNEQLSQTDPASGPSSYNWAYTEVSDAAGIPGQGTSNPASLFGNHQVVIGGTYYDPFYGLKHSSLDNIDANAIDGFFVIRLKALNEAAYNLDLNSDGDKTDLAVPTAVFMFRKNPAGNDLTQQRENR